MTYGLVLMVCLSFGAQPITASNIQDSQPAAQARDHTAFKFMLGDWRSENGATQEVETLMEDGIIQERWDEVVFKAIVIRSYNSETERWNLTFFATDMDPQVWEGRYEDGRWNFHRTWNIGGEEIHSRTYWLLTGPNSYSRTVEQSRDGGHTWRRHDSNEYARINS